MEEEDASAKLKASIVKDSVSTIKCANQTTIKYPHLKSQGKLEPPVFW